MLTLPSFAKVDAAEGGRKETRILLKEETSPPSARVVWMNMSQPSMDHLLLVEVQTTHACHDPVVRVAAPRIRRTVKVSGLASHSVRRLHQPPKEHKMYQLLATACEG